MQFLMGLNESFSHVRAQILLLDPIPPVNKVFSLLVQEEHQRNISVSSTSSSSPSEAMAFGSQNHSSFGKNRRDKML